MKSISFFIIIIALAASSGCLNSGKGKEDKNQADTSTVADTGFTGITQYRSGNFISYEVTFKNGVRNGLMKTFYPSGKVRTTFWYENGLREDTAIWYWEDGKIFRKTPFKRDSINGVQIQYWTSGRIKAKLEYVDGLRKPYIEEFTSDGKKITVYPELVVNTKDDYNQNGMYKISLGLNQKNVKANYYLGEYIDGLFTPKKYTKLNTSDFTGSLQLKKTGTPGDSYIGIIAEINTSYGNKYHVYKKVELPYNDLK